MHKADACCHFVSATVEQGSSSGAPTLHTVRISGKPRRSEKAYQRPLRHLAERSPCKSVVRKLARAFDMIYSTQTPFYYTQTLRRGVVNRTLVFHLLVFVFLNSFGDLHVEARVLVDTNVAVAHQEQLQFVIARRRHRVLQSHVQSPPNRNPLDSQ